MSEKKPILQHKDWSYRGRSDVEAMSKEQRTYDPPSKVAKCQKSQVVK